MQVIGEVIILTITLFIRHYLIVSFFFCFSFQLILECLYLKFQKIDFFIAFLESTKFEIYSVKIS